MSGSSGTNTVTQTIPSWMQNYISNTYNTAQDVANIPYSPYSGQGVAPLNSTEQQGLGQLASAGTNNTGMSTINNAAATAANAAAYTPTNVNYAAPTAASINSYLSPYLNQVQNTTNQALEQQGQINNQQTAASATAQGAYGGSRQGVQTALNNYYTGQNIAQADANIQNTGYNTALGAAQTTAQQQMAAQEANQNAGLTANQQAITGSMIGGQLGQAQSSTALSNANAAYTAGQVAQSTQQAQDTYGYNQYLQNLMWPYQQLSALEGATYQGNSGSSTTSPYYSNTAGQIAGLGMAGLGLAGSLGLFGGSAAGGAAAAGSGLAEGAMLLA